MQKKSRFSGAAKKRIFKSHADGHRDNQPTGLADCLFYANYCFGVPLFNGQCATSIRERKKLGGGSEQLQFPQRPESFFPEWCFRHPENQKFCYDCVG
jgi:hypothetical protein